MEENFVDFEGSEMGVKHVPYPRRLMELTNVRYNLSNINCWATNDLRSVIVSVTCTSHEVDQMLCVH